MTLNTRRGAPLGPLIRPLHSRYARFIGFKVGTEKILDVGRLEITDAIPDTFCPHIVAESNLSMDRYLSGI